MPQYCVRGQRVHPHLIETAKYHRKNQTPAEGMLWENLRVHRLSGWKFRHQQIIGRFFVSFYGHKASLVIELDGKHHEETDQKEYDSERDRCLKERGLHLMRIPNDRVIDEIDQLLNEILKACEET